MKFRLAGPLWLGGPVGREHLIDAFFQQLGRLIQRQTFDGLAFMVSEQDGEGDFAFAQVQLLDAQF